MAYFDEDRLKKESDLRTLNVRTPDYSSSKVGFSSRNIMEGVADFANVNKWSNINNKWYVNGNEQQGYGTYFEKGNCYGTGLPAGKCDGLLNSILNGNAGSIYSYVSGISDAEWKIARNSIKDIFPTTALLILKRLGFARSSCNVGGNTVDCVESVDDWFRNTRGVIGDTNESYFTPDQMSSFNSNTAALQSAQVSNSPQTSSGPIFGGNPVRLSIPQHLGFLQWLGYLSLFANRNRLLNPTSNVVIPSPIKPVDDKIAVWVQPPASDTEYSNGLLKLWGLRRPTSVPMVQAHPTFGFGFAGMAGGAIGLTCGQEGGATSPAQFLVGTLKRELDLLKSMGKSLNSNDQATVDKLMLKLVEKEQEVVALINGAMAYSTDMRAARDYRQASLSKDALSSYTPINKPYGSYYRYTDKLTQILMELRKLTANSPSYASADRRPL